jgi:hypothetical protein
MVVEPFFMVEVNALKIKNYVNLTAQTWVNVRVVDYLEFGIHPIHILLIVMLKFLYRDL